MNMELAKRIPLFLILASSLATAYCTSAPTTLHDIEDGGILSGKPCSPPCFWGIDPGVTTKGEATEILQRQGASSPQQEGNIVSYGNSAAFQYDENDLVDRVAFAPSSVITVGEILAKYGIPDAVEVTHDIASTPEHNYFDMQLYYDDLHTHFVLEQQEVWPAYVLSQDTSIAKSIYFAEKAYDAAKKASEHLSAWKGYGSYKDPNPHHWP